MVASNQAMDLDKERIRLETKIHEMEKKASQKARERIKLEDKTKCLSSEVKELKNLAEELRTNIIHKESRLDHLQKKSDELASSLCVAKDKAVKEFKTSNEFTKFLDENYTAGFEDFCQDASEAFPRVDFSSIKLPIAIESSLLLASSEDVNIEDDAITSLLFEDGAKSWDIVPSGISP